MGSALFVGREKEIEDLRMEYLEADQGIAKTIWGLPGTGKTELVNQVFSEEELAKHRENEALANELQEKMVEAEEQRKRENAELIDKAIDLCEEILGKGKYELLA